MKLPRVLSDNHSGTLHPKAFRDSPKSDPTFIMEIKKWKCDYCGHSNSYYMLDCHHCGAGGRSTNE